jgi:hypothetical protein
MTSVEQRLSQALDDMASQVTMDALSPIAARTDRRQSSSRRRIVVAGVAAAVVALAVWPTVALRGRHSTTPASGNQSDAPTYFVAVDWASGRPGVYDARTARRVSEIPWPGAGKVTALASRGDGRTFVGAESTADCNSELRDITVSIVATGFETAVSPVLTTLPGRTSSLAASPSGAVAAALTCADNTSLALLDGTPGDKRVFTGSIFDQVDTGIALSANGRQVAFLASAPARGVYVLDTTTAGDGLTGARLVRGIRDGDPPLHLPRFVDSDTALLVGVEGLKSGPDDAATYSLAKLAIGTGQLEPVVVMPARGWEGLAVDVSGRHALAVIGERIVRVDDGRVSMVRPRDAGMYQPAW